MLLTLPPTMTMLRAEKAAYRLLEALHRFPGTLHYTEWKQWAYPEASEEAARRTWERHKQSWRELGVPLTLVDSKSPERPSHVCIKSIRFLRSEAYAMVQGILGDAYDGSPDEHWPNVQRLVDRAFGSAA